MKAVRWEVSQRFHRKEPVSDFRPVCQKRCWKAPLYIEHALKAYMLLKLILGSGTYRSSRQLPKKWRIWLRTAAKTEMCGGNLSMLFIQSMPERDAEILTFLLLKRWLEASKLSLGCHYLRGQYLEKFGLSCIIGHRSYACVLSRSLCSCLPYLTFFLWQWKVIFIRVYFTFIILEGGRHTTTRAGVCEVIIKVT